MYTQAVGLQLPDDGQYIGLTLYARMFDGQGVQVGTTITGQFVEYGNGNYTLVYDQFPDEFRGTIAFYNFDDDSFLASCEMNPTSAIVIFNMGEEEIREKDIVIYKGATTNFVWNSSTFNNPTEIVLTIKYDMADPVEDAMLVVSLTSGCEWALGLPYNVSSDAIISFDENFIYCVLTGNLTQLFTSVTGIQQYDVVVTENTLTHPVAYGQCSVILSGGA